MTFTLNLSHSLRDPCPRRHSGSAPAGGREEKKRGTVSVGRGGRQQREAHPDRPGLHGTAESTALRDGPKVVLCGELQASLVQITLWGEARRPWAPALPKFQSFPSLCVVKN